MSNYPGLQNFFSAYFHQDWAMEHESAEAVTEYYRDSEGDALVAQTREELVALLSREDDEDELAARVRGLGCEYDPSAEGSSYREWLTSIAARLSA